VDGFENGNTGEPRVFFFFSNSSSWMRMLGRLGGHRGPPSEASRQIPSITLSRNIRLVFIASCTWPLRHLTMTTHQHIISASVMHALAYCYCYQAIYR
jgi:hypothetical protein